MAVSDLYTVDTGTATSGDVLTYATGTTNADGTWTVSKPISIYNPNPQIKAIRDPFAGKTTKTIDDVFKKKTFWDGVEWEEYTSYIPRKSITGKIIIGKMHKRWRSASMPYRGPNGIGNHKQFAKTKELFEGKLKGTA
jgi:hypothetical protein